MLYHATFSADMMKIYLHKERMEYLLPVFFGGLSSLVLCAMLSVRAPDTKEPESAPVYLVEVQESIEEVYLATSLAEEPPLEDEALQIFAGKPEKKQDLVLKMYREPEAREWVTDFFTTICASREIAEVILANADQFDIPPALAFALSWEESRFNPKAENSTKNQDGSIDRGLFQLNNRSFPRLGAQTFFDPKINAYYGMSHLRFCLDSGGSEIMALATYNAGAGKVKNTGAPRHTLDYIHRILENREKIDARFHARVQREAEARIAEKTRRKRIVVTPEQDMHFLLNEFSEKIVEAEPARPRPLRFAPLSGAIGPLALGF
jgi:soluble lytic murein transglycosylase-like protein